MKGLNKRLAAAWNAFVYSDSLTRTLLFDTVCNVSEIERGARLLPWADSLTQRLIAVNRAFLHYRPDNRGQGRARTKKKGLLAKGLCTTPCWPSPNHYLVGISHANKMIPYVSRQ